MLIGHYYLYKTDLNNDVLIYKASQRCLKPNSTHTVLLHPSFLPLALGLHQHFYTNGLLLQSNGSAQIHVHLEIGSKKTFCTFPHMLSNILLQFYVDWSQSTGCMAVNGFCKAPFILCLWRCE